MSKYCKFNPNWAVNHPEFYWVEACKDSTSAHCNLCNKTFSLSNMGLRALQSHMQGKKHKQIVAAKKSTFGMEPFVATSHTTPDKKNTAVTPAATMPTASTSSAASGTTPTADMPSTSSAQPAPTLAKWVKKETTVQAEIKWVLFSVSRHFSLRDVEECITAMQNIVDDSATIQDMQLKKDKVSYMTTFGCGPYFKETLLYDIQRTGFFCISFDESPNQVSRTSQMDIIVRYPNLEMTEVATRYLDSAFLERTKADNLFQEIKKHCFDMTELNPANALQLAMDGPNVNWSTYNLFSKFVEEQSSTKPILVGSCGLHVVNNAFRNGHKESELEIMKLLRSGHKLFKNSLARRDDFVQINNIDTSVEMPQLPVKYCEQRWLANRPVAERMLKIWPNMVRYVKSASNMEGNESFDVLKKAVRDVFTPVKLAFFITQAEKLEPFLTKFQSDEPLIPYLYSDLLAMLTSLITSVTKKEVVQSHGVVKIDLKKQSNLIDGKDFNLGFRAKSELSKLRRPKEHTELKLHEQAVLKFKKQAMKFVIGVCIKLQERSPLKYKVVKNAQSLNPKRALKEPEDCKESFSNLLQVFVDNGKQDAAQAERIAHLYSTMVDDDLVKAKLASHTNERLDHFWSKVLFTVENKPLKVFVFKVLVLFHGQAQVERSFSINENIMSENMKEKTLIAQKLICDGNVKALLNGKLPVKLVEKCKTSNRDYKHYLKMESEKKTALSDKKQLKRRLEKEIDEIQAKKKATLETASSEVERLEKDLQI